MAKQELGFREGMTRMEYEVLTSIPKNIVRGLVDLLASFLGAGHSDGNRRKQGVYQKPTETQYRH
jgi:hypothetical protein